MISRNVPKIQHKPAYVGFLDFYVGIQVVSWPLLLRNSPVARLMMGFGISRMRAFGCLLGGGRHHYVWTRKLRASFYILRASLLVFRSISIVSRKLDRSLLQLARRFIAQPTVHFAHGGPASAPLVRRSSARLHVTLSASLHTPGICALVCATCAQISHFNYNYCRFA